MSAFESADQDHRRWRVGQLAGLTGLTVRALHHYDQIGLLVPARRSSAGHRLYDSADVGRLYRICALRRLGFPLERIAEVLDRPQWQLKDVVSSHLVDTRRTAAVASRLASRLSALATALDDLEELSAEQLFSTIEETNMLDSPLRATTSILVYSDVAAAHDYLVRILGLTAGALQTDDAGTAVHGEVSAGYHTIWLHPAAEGYQSPAQLGAATG